MQKNATQLSLYYAIEKASYEISGNFHHESAVMEAVRDAIETQRQSDKFSHILMDFNNSQSAMLTDLHTVLNLAKNNLKQVNQ